MATYEFRCCGVTKEIISNIFLDLVIPKCDICNGDMARIYTPSAIAFKGKGFYSTDK